MQLSISQPTLVGYAFRAADSALLTTYNYSLLDPSNNPIGQFQQTITNMPGDDISTLPEAIQAAVNTVWPAVIAAQQAAAAAEKATADQEKADELVALQTALAVAQTNQQPAVVASIQAQIDALQATS